MIDIYIKHTDDNYYKLDLDLSESVNFKLTVKDLTDITKVFSPFTQSFNLNATDKNKMLCGFIGNEKILRTNNTGEFDSLIYISGFLFQSGKLSFEETDYKFQDQKGFKTTFESNLTSLTDRLGDSTIQDLFMDENGEFDPKVKTPWTSSTVKEMLSSVETSTLSNGIEFKKGIPFISNNRAWVYNQLDLNEVDNIAFNPVKNIDNANYINRSEIRPSVNYMSIMNHLLLRIGTPIVCPIFESPEVKDLMALCNSESLVVPDASAIPVTDYTPLIYLRYDTKDDGDSVPLPTVPRWTVTGGGASGIFQIKRNDSADRHHKWSDGIDITLNFQGLVSLEGGETKIKVVLKRASDDAILDSQEITGSTYVWRLLDPLDGVSQLDQNGEITYKFEILPTTLVSWDSFYIRTIQAFYYKSKAFYGGIRVTRAKFSSTAINATLATSLGGGELNLITALPKMKCVDFLKSFFKTFNISVIATGLNDQSMFWLTPDNINEYNKPYSKRIVNYTNYVDVATLNKKKANNYNVYSFSHFDSEYFDAVYGDGTKFGSLSYPEILPDKPTEFKVETDYSIIKQSNFFNHPSSAKVCLAFSKDDPEVLNNGANRYDPVYEEFTIFYLNSKSLGFDGLSVEFTDTVNDQIFRVLEATFINPTNGKTLAFGNELGNTNSLYLNYYKDFIELLLKPNTYSSEFVLTLPSNEIFLNFANLKQGESNIPTGFRPQNEIIIGEQRYKLIDSIIDLTPGKTKLTLLNF